MVSTIDVNVLPHGFPQSKASRQGHFGEANSFVGGAKSGKLFPLIHRDREAGEVYSMDMGFLLQPIQG